MRPPADAITLGHNEPALAPGASTPTQERPDLVQSLGYRTTQVQVRTVLDDVYREVRAVYVKDGWPGVRDLRKANTAGAMPGDVDGVFTGVPVADAERAALSALLDAGEARVLEIGSRAVELVGRAAAQDGRSLLLAARAEIEAEEARYRSRRSSPALEELRVAIRDLAPEKARLTAATRAVNERAAEVTASVREALAAVGSPPMAVTPSYWQGLLDADAEYPDREASRRLAAVELAGALARVAPAMPALWRVYDADPEDPVALLDRVATLLTDAGASNRALTARLEGDARVVWQYPVLVRGAMTRRHVPELSIAWRAVEDELAGENPGLRASGKVTMLTGLAGMAAPAIVGSGPAAPWVLGAVALADVAATVWDSVEEWREYLEARDAERAVLNPSLSWTTAPDLFGAVFATAMNALGVLGAPADAARATRVRP